jgi:hypothetical protein
MANAKAYLRVAGNAGLHASAAAGPRMVQQNVMALDSRL